MAKLVSLGDESGSGKPFALHEVAIGLRDRTLWQLAQCIVIVEDRRQERLLGSQLFADFAQRECAHARNVPLRG